MWLSDGRRGDEEVVCRRGGWSVRGVGVEGGMRDAAVAKDEGESSEDDFEIFGVSRDDCGVL